MRIRIYTYGVLKNLCPKDLFFEVSTPAEAIKALGSQVKAMRPIPGQPRIQLRAVGYDTFDKLHSPFKSDTVELHLVPDFTGGKKGGLMQIIVGIIIVVVAVVAAIPTGGGSLVWGTGLLGTTAGTVAFAGAMMILGGVMQMLSPAPEMDLDFGDSGAGDPAASKYLGAPANTVAIGTRIPMGYGYRRVGGHYLSFDVKAVDVAL
jgi:predicted phage tail protein